jgi:hypothetical protein
MKNPLSLIACILIAIVLFTYRLSYSEVGGDRSLKVTTWDAFGYYMYLPSSLIYHDMTELKWLDSIDKKYNLTGGQLYQANKHDNGKYVYKYLGGVALIQLPFFLIGHVIALNSDYPADGFSPPYQYAISFGAIIYCILALFLLRRILLRYYTDATAALTLLLLALATNLIQYVSIDSAMSHAFIFPLYVLILYTTIKWHEQPRIILALAIGYIIGLATISRPTEAVMLFIPLLWNTQNKEASQTKWKLVKEHRSHIAAVVFGGLLGILPQLIYWKIATGSFIYDVGSKWSFLNPFFRVLFGPEKGWFIYTPVTIFFIIGMFFIRPFPFRNSVIWFCLLNIYIIISWFDWRYGASYSTRALVQSYPVFALPFAAFIQRVNTTKWRYLFYALSICLIALNLYQISLYNRGLIPQ